MIAYGLGLILILAGVVVSHMASLWLGLSVSIFGLIIQLVALFLAKCELERDAALQAVLLECYRQRHHPLRTEEDKKS